MAAGSLLALLDDIATMLDDVSVMTQVAAKKTAGVLGDDLALNAQQVSGVSAARELPVVWAVAKGSFINKLILVPAALAISYFAPWAITPLLMIGGAFLCFEGFEKLVHHYLHKKQNLHHEAAIAADITTPKQPLSSLEQDKIKGAIRTDFILSAEIIVIALGTVSNEVFSKQVSVVSAIAILMTVGVYGLVATIVKLDDVGLYMMLRKGHHVSKQIIRKVGQLLVSATPYIMRTLTALGTAAMFLVGGSIIAHGIPPLHHFTTPLSEISMLLPILVDAVVGIMVGAVCVGVFELSQRCVPKNIKKMPDIRD